MNCFRFPDPSSVVDQLFEMRSCLFPLVVLLTLFSMALTLLCLTFGYVIVFQNFYYIPILLVCMAWPEKGILYTTFLGAFYVALCLIIPTGRDLLTPALIRLFFFELVALSTIFLRTCWMKAQAGREEFRDERECRLKKEVETLQMQLDKSLQANAVYAEKVELMDTVIDNIRTPLIIWNGGGYITRTNSAFKELFGMPDAELLGRKISDIHDVYDAWRQSGFSPIETKMADSSGKPRKMHWLFSPTMKPNSTEYIRVAAIGLEVADANDSQGLKDNG